VQQAWGEWVADEAAVRRARRIYPYHPNNFNQHFCALSDRNNVDCNNGAILTRTKTLHTQYFH
jgi:hypothetical protein